MMDIGRKNRMKQNCLNKKEINDNAEDIRATKMPITISDLGPIRRCLPGLHIGVGGCFCVTQL